MSIKIVDKKALLNKASSDIAVGTTFWGAICGQPTELFLRTYNGIVSPSNPGRTWTADDSPIYLPDIQNYRGVDIEIKIL